MFVRDALDSFLTAREAEGRTGGTIQFYRERLGHLAFDEIEQITPDALRRFFLAYSNGHAAGGIHALYRAVKAFLNWLEAEEVMPPEWRNPIRKVKPPKIDRRPVVGVTLGELAAMLEVASVRDRAILLVMFDSGVRSSELIGLQRADVDASGRVLVRKSKSRKPRYVFVGPRPLAALGAYLSARSDNDPALFLRDDGLPLARVGLREVLRGLSRRAKLTRHIHPHLLRHGMAIAFVRSGGGLAELQSILGHSSPVTTRRYLVLETADLQAAFVRCTPSQGIA